MSDFKDNQGRMLTMSLFRETVTNDKFDPVYTLKEYDIDKFPSAYLIYMEAIDEYDAAMRLVGSMRHWEKLCGCNWFMNGVHQIGFPGLKVWREDKQRKDESLGKKALMELAQSGNVQAAKLLYEGKKETKGRPKKSDIEKAAKAEAEKDKEIDILWDRMQVISNDKE